MRNDLENQKHNDNIRHKYVYNTLLWDKLMDHKLRYPDCYPEYKDLGYSRKYALERKLLDEAPNVPDAERFKMLDGINVDRKHIDLDKAARSSLSINDTARNEMDEMDKRLFDSERAKHY